MTSVPPISPLPAEINAGPTGPKFFTVGTLKYTQKEIYVLFFWLMWNEFCLMLMERVPTFTNFMYIDNGATNATIGMFGTITGFCTMWINPILSTYSDRFRSRAGRRRPFLLFAAPPFALFLILLPFMPEAGKWAERFPLLAHFFHITGIGGPVYALAVCSFFIGVFNAMILTIFNYFYWDVVPENILGRFNGLGKVVTSASAFIWLFFLQGLGDHHMKALLILTAAICFTVFMVSTWRVKEGKYPPPEPRPTRAWWEPIRSYFKDCFSEMRYVWIFVGFTVYQLGNAGNNFQNYYLHYDLHLSFDIMGKYQAIPLLVFMVLGYGMGVLTDKLKPVRLLPRALLIWSFMNLISYYFVRDKWSYLICFGLVQAAIFAYGILLGAFTVEVYPREKIGQFCSASATSQAVAGLLAGIPIGLFFDHIHNNRFGYLWSCSFQLAAALIFYKVYHNWVRQQREHPTIIALEKPSHIDDDALST